MRWIREEEERIVANDESALKCVILDMTGMLSLVSVLLSSRFVFFMLFDSQSYLHFPISAVTAIDTSGIDTVCELRKMLDKKSLQVRALASTL